MQFDDRTIETIFSKWLYKHYPKLSERKPIPYTDWWVMDIKLKEMTKKIDRMSL